MTLGRPFEFEIEVTGTRLEGAINWLALSEQLLRRLNK